MTKSNQAYELLEEMITFQDLAPGSMVSESILVELTGMGRSPVREALQRLANDKMIEIYPSKGILIKPISVETQLKLLEVRRFIGEYTNRMAACRATMEHRKEMLQIIDELNKIEQMDQLKMLFKLLKRIHQLTILAAQNEYLDLVLSPLQGLARRFWLAHLDNRAEELKKVAHLYAVKLHAISCSDENAAGAASLNINNYFTEYTYKTLSGIVKL
ncbi:GntR family transcriptional regulator [Zophobihabitans entericus]|nr:GntR family transcriptional regulator [Zophobihabitans entericus]